MDDRSLASVGGRLRVVRRGRLHFAVCPLAVGIGTTISSAIADLRARLVRH